MKKLELYYLLICLHCIFVSLFAQSNRCFRKYPNCIVVSSQPFDRQSSVSAEDCQNRCLTFNSGRYSCKSFVYNTREQVCDLYDHTGKDPPARLIQFPGRDYYEPTGLCTGTSTPGPAPSSCPPGQVAQFSSLQGFELDGSDTQVVQGVTQAECVQICQDNRTPDGQSVTCRSTDYFSSRSECIVSDAVALPTGTGRLNPNPDSTYLQKFCTTIPSGQGCPPSVDRQPQTLLVGIATVVIDTPSVEECMRRCYEETSITCISGMFFLQPGPGNCILTPADSTTNPELIMRGLDPTEDAVEYFELKCGGGAFRAVPNNGLNRPRSQSNNVHGNNVRPIKTQPFHASPTCPAQKCCPYQGSCRMGMKTLSDGRTQWCLNPCA